MNTIWFNQHNYICKKTKSKGKIVIGFSFRRFLPRKSVKLLRGREVDQWTNTCLACARDQIQSIPSSIHIHTHTHSLSLSFSLSNWNFRNNVTKLQTENYLIRQYASKWLENIQVLTENFLVSLRCFHYHNSLVMAIQAQNGSKEQVLATETQCFAKSNRVNLLYQTQLCTSLPRYCKYQIEIPWPKATREGKKEHELWPMTILPQTSAPGPLAH